MIVVSLPCCYILQLLEENNNTITISTPPTLSDTGVLQMVAQEKGIMVNIIIELLLFSTVISIHVSRVNCYIIF